MKTTSLSTISIAALVAALACGMTARATTAPGAQVLNSPGMSADWLETVAFRDSAEADMLRRAYHILATGDHDYNGHRVRAMHSVEEAGKLLGMDLAGDLKDRTPQRLSDDKLREAEGLINQVLGSAEVKDQKKIVKHLNEAAKQIHTALNVR
jgi:hypothetical protein